VIKPIPRGRKAWKAAWDKWLGFDTARLVAELDLEREAQSLDREIAEMERAVRKGNKP
jgi:hypothetical protein